MISELTNLFVDRLLKLQSEKVRLDEQNKKVLRDNQALHGEIIILERKNKELAEKLEYERKEHDRLMETIEGLKKQMEDSKND